MAIKERVVIIKWARINKKYYENKGYAFTGYGDEFEVKVEDLTKGVSVFITPICDITGEECPSILYKDYIKNIENNNGIYVRFGFNNIKRKEEQRIKEPKPKEPKKIKDKIKTIPKPKESNYKKIQTKFNINIDCLDKESNIDKNGIYLIRNIVNNKLYVGQVFREGGFYIRWNGHVNALNGNYHYNIHLQNAWNKYGKESFEFLIIEVVEDESTIDNREIYWIAFYDSFKNGYNRTLGGKTTKGMVASDETKRKMSESRKGDKHHMWKKHPSQETREKISKNKKGKSFGDMRPQSTLTNNQVAEIKQRLVNGEKIIDLAKEFNVPKHIIEHIKSVKSWEYVNPDLNSELRKMIKPKNKLNFSEKIIQEIKYRFENENITKTQLGKEYGCSGVTIGNIIKGVGMYAHI